VGFGGRYIILLVSDCTSMILVLRLETVLMLAVEALGVIWSPLVGFRLVIFEKLIVVGCYEGS